MNGQVPQITTMVGPTDSVAVDGRPVQIAKARLWRFHKPKGLIVSHADELHRPSVFDHVRQSFKDLPRVISVGRLDYNSEGLLLLTNSGTLARTLEHPATHLERVYKARVYGQARGSFISRSMLCREELTAPFLLDPALDARGDGQGDYGGRGQVRSHHRLILGRTAAAPARSPPPSGARQEHLGPDDPARGQGGICLIKTSQSHSGPTFLSSSYSE